jgi:uncharacterized protein YggU (UPF0235/DUF167 family)
VVKVCVPSKAVDGAANRAIVDALAKVFGVRRSAVTIRRGHGARVKHVEISGDVADLMGSVASLPTKN